MGRPSRRGRADRISKLPDAVLCTVLSFLDSTKSAVRTSVLPTRWRSLWASTPSLNFDDSEFHSPEGFDDSVDTVLLLREVSEIQNFSLRCSARHRHLGTWIRFAVNHGVQGLHLCRLRFLTKAMINSIFTCQSLVVLRIDHWTGDALLLASVRLARLRAMHLQWITFTDGSLGKILSGCPVLEHVYLGGCIFPNLIRVSSQKLKSLRMHSVGYVQADIPHVHVSAPNLLSLDLCGSALNCYLENSSSLLSLTVEAKAINIQYAKILQGLYNVTQLKISDPILQHVFNEISSLSTLPTFGNLKSLSLTTSLCEGSVQAITCLLHCCPSLYELMIFMFEFEGFKILLKQWEPTPSATNLLKNLLRVSIIDFQSNPGAQKFIEFILLNTIASLTVTPSQDRLLAYGR